MKFIKKHKVASLMIALLFFGFIIGATTWDGSWSTFTDVWVGDSSDTPVNTLSANSLYVAGDAEITGTLYMPDGVTRPIPGITGDMAGFTVDSSNDIDDATAPNLTIADNIPAIIWDNSGETVGIMKTFRLPPNYKSSSALVFYALVSSDTGDASVALDWQFWDNATGTTYDAAAIAQDSVSSTQSNLDGSCEVLTLTLDATGIAAMTAGHFYTIELFNATTHASANLELKGFDGVYTATN